MSWYLDSEGNLKEQEENAPVDLSGSGGAGGTPVNAGAAPSSAAAPTSSGNYTSFNKYLELNQPQAQKLGEKVAGGIEANTQKASDSLTQGENEFNQNLSQSGPSLTPDQIQGAAKDPTKFVKDPSNIAKFQSSEAGQYNGPNSFADVTGYDDLIKNLGTATNAKEQAMTSGGRQELIKNVYQKPERAKQGMLNLDEGLLKGSAAAFAPVQEKANATSALNDRINQIQVNAAPKIQAQQQAVQDSQKSIQDNFLGDNGAYNRLKNTVTDRAKQVGDEATAAEDDARNYLDMDYLKKNGIITTPDPRPFNADGATSGYTIQDGPVLNENKVKISSKALDQLGISMGQYLDLLRKYTNPDALLDDPQGQRTALNPSWRGGLDLDSYADFSSPTDANINPSSVASQEEYDTLQALSQLLGDRVDPSLIKKDQLGKYNSDLTNFRYDDLLKYLSNPTYQQVGVRND